jgi:hypothetical protein
VVDTTPAQTSTNTERPIEQRVGIPGQYSVFVHCWHTLATLAVFLGHATRPDILFDADFSLIGRATIPTFLIVSGYFTTMSFAHGGRFFKKMAKRYFNMWVFFIPATALILAMDVYLISIDSIITSRGKFDPDLSFGRIALDVFNMLTFSGEYWKASTFGQGAFSNQAFWTMDYIMGYTLLTAAIYLITGWQRLVAIVFISALVDPTVLLLAPLWFAGVAAYEVHQRALYHKGVTSLNVMAARLRFLGIRVHITTLKRIGLGACVLVAAVWLTLEWMQWGPQLYKYSKGLIAYEWRQHLGMAERYLWQWAYVPILFSLLVFARFYLDGPAPALLSRPTALVSSCLNYISTRS